MDHRQSESCPKTSNDCEQRNPSSDEDVREFSLLQISEFIRWSIFPGEIAYIFDLDEIDNFRNLSVENQQDRRGESEQGTSQQTENNVNFSNVNTETVNETSFHLGSDSRFNRLQPGISLDAGNSDCLVGALSFVSDDKGNPHSIESNTYGSAVDAREFGISNTNKTNDIQCDDGHPLLSVNENLAVAGPSRRNADNRRKPYDRPFVCTVCGKDFRFQSDFDRHYQTHTGEKPYECNICGKAFTQASDVVVHLRTHTGEKPFVCETCEKSFRTSSHLNRHRKTHK